MGSQHGRILPINETFDNLTDITFTYENWHQSTWPVTLVITHLILTIMGIFGNLLAFVVLFRGFGDIGRTILFLLRHQAVIDGLSCILLFCMMMARVRRTGVHWLDSTSCYLWHSQAVVRFSLAVSTWNLMLIALERFVAVCYPLKHNTFGVRHAACAIISIYAFSIVGNAAAASQVYFDGYRCLINFDLSPSRPVVERPFKPPFVQQSCTSSQSTQTTTTTTTTTTYRPEPTHPPTTMVPQQSSTFAPIVRKKRELIDEISAVYGIPVVVPEGSDTISRVRFAPEKDYTYQTPIIGDTRNTKQRDARKGGDHEISKLFGGSVSIQGDSRYLPESLFHMISSYRMKREAPVEVREGNGQDTTIPEASEMVNNLQTTEIGDNRNDTNLDDTVYSLCMKRNPGNTPDCTEYISERAPYILVLMLLYSFIYFIPMFISLMLYSAIVRTFRKRKRCDMMTSSRVIDRATVELTKTLVAITVVFVITFGYEFIYLLLSYFGFIRYVLKSPHEQIALQLVALNQCMNPLIFILFLPVYRRRTVRLLTSICRHRCHRPHPSDANGNVPLEMDRRVGNGVQVTGTHAPCKRTSGGGGSRGRDRAGSARRSASAERNLAIAMMDVVATSEVKLFMYTRTTNDDFPTPCYLPHANDDTGEPEGFEMEEGEEEEKEEEEEEEGDKV